MRIWDIEPKKLCRAHLLGEHRELHAIWSILTKGKRGYSNHPETKRWRGKLRALYLRHNTLIKEMEKRGYSHKSNLNSRLSKGCRTQHSYIDPPYAQLNILRNKKCGCKV